MNDLRKIIICGPKGSGKSWAASAIADGHNNVKNTTLHQLKKELENELKIESVINTADLIIVDECSSEDILTMDEKFTTMEDSGTSCSIIYLTQDEVTNESLGNDDFLIIQCISQTA